MSDELLNALKQQTECYERLVKLAAQQHVHVQNAQTEQLLEVLSQRQEILNKVSELEQQLAPARQNWSQYLSSLGPAEAALGEQLLARSRQLLEQITAADREDALMLQQRKLNLGKQIGHVRAAGQVNRTYAAGAYGRQTTRVDVGG